MKFKIGDLVCIRWDMFSNDGTQFPSGTICVVIHEEKLETLKDRKYIPVFVTDKSVVLSDIYNTPLFQALKEKNES